MSHTSSWEPFLRRLGSVLEASWACLRGQHSPKLATQIEGKSIKNRCKMDAFQVAILMHVRLIFGRKMEACWHQDRIKNRSQFRKGDFFKN